MLIFRSVFHHWRVNLAVLGAVLVAAMVLTGSLLMGDVVKRSLLRLAEIRLGKTQTAVVSRGETFGEGLSPRVQVVSGRQDLLATGLLQVRGTMELPDRSAFAGGVQVLGVDERFWKFAPKNAGVSRDGLWLSQALASALGKNGVPVTVGTEINLRVERLSFLPRDAPMSSDTRKDTQSIRSFPVAGILSDEELGRFSLAADQVAPRNAFLPLPVVQELAAMPGQVNLFLFGSSSGQTVTTEQLDAWIGKVWEPSDVGLHVKVLPRGGTEIRSPGVFLDSRLDGKIGADSVLTYLVNDLASGDQTRPYSMVSALPPKLLPGLTGVESLDDQGIVLIDWLAERLNAKVGSQITLKYWLMGRGRELTDAQASFTVRAVVPLKTLAADRTLMPDFPGMKGRPSCSEWDSSLPIDTKRFTKDDEAYWKEYEGTPKAFISLDAGRRLWQNRFGHTTALRFPADGPSAASIAAILRTKVDQRSYGLFGSDVAGLAHKAASAAMDFGELFISLSFFLIAAALLLTALLFALGAAARQREVGLLLALGYTRRAVRRRLLLEGLAIASIGSVLGSLLGLLYARILFGIITGPVVAAAMGGTGLVFEVSGMTVLIGIVSVIAVVGITLWWTLRHLANQQPALLLRSLALGTATEGKYRRWPWILGALLVLGGAVLALGVKPEPAQVMRFFGAGWMLLIGGLLLAWALLGLLGRSAEPRSLSGIVLAGASRNRGRSLAVIGILASASFLVVALSAFHQDANRETGRSSGTGGFAFWATSTLPIFRDLNTEAGLKDARIRSRSASAGRILEDIPVPVSFVPLRSLDGDDATCLNLNRAQKPRLWGIDGQELAKRQAFSFDSVQSGATSAWLLLQRPLPSGRVPAIIDSNTAQWAIGVGLGDHLSYDDGHGKPFEVEVVALIANSMLQGGVFIDQQRFEHLFPAAAGFSALLIDAPGIDEVNRVALQKLLEQRLRDMGLSAQDCRVKLAGQFAMQNMYIAIFQILGALGLLLGSFGLAAVLMRSVLERRGELALMRSIGYPQKRLLGVLIWENAVLLILGLGLGTLAAVVAVLPIVLQPGRPPALNLVGGLLVAVLLAGLAAIVLSARLAMGKNLITDLRSE